MSINNDILSAGGEVVVRARRGTDQATIPNSTLTTLIFNIEDADPENAWDGSTYTVPESGFYEFLLTVRFGSTGTIGPNCEWQLLLKNNAVSSIFQRAFSANAVSNMVVSGFYYASLAKGALVQLQVYPVMPNASTIRIDGSVLPTALLIRRH